MLCFCWHPSKVWCFFLVVCNALQTEMCPPGWEVWPVQLLGDATSDLPAVGAFKSDWESRYRWGLRIAVPADGQ